jgi:hypothetical protein
MCRDAIVTSLDFGLLMQLAEDPRFARSLGDIARLTIQFIEHEPASIRLVPVPRLIAVLRAGKWPKYGIDVLHLLLSIARHDCLPLILESDTDSLLFVCAGECDFRVRELVLEVYWRGFASIPVEDRLSVLDSDAFLMMVCGRCRPT